MCVSVLFSNLHSKTPGGQDFTENIKHMVWLKVGLDCLEIVKSESLLSKQLVSHCLTNNSVWRLSKVSHCLTTLSVRLRFLSDSSTQYVFLSSFQYMVRLCFLAHSSKRYICSSAHSSICRLVFLRMASTRGTKRVNILVVAFSRWIIFPYFTFGTFTQR